MTNTERAEAAAAKTKELSRIASKRVKEMAPSWERTVLDSGSAVLSRIANEVERYAAKVKEAHSEFQASAFADYCERRARVAAQIAG